MRKPIFLIQPVALAPTGECKQQIQQPVMHAHSRLAELYSRLRASAAAQHAMCSTRRKRKERLRQWAITMGASACKQWQPEAMCSISTTHGTPRRLGLGRMFAQRRQPLVYNR